MTVLYISTIKMIVIWYFKQKSYLNIINTVMIIFISIAIAVVAAVVYHCQYSNISGAIIIEIITNIKIMEDITNQWFWHERVLFDKTEEIQLLPWRPASQNLPTQLLWESWWRMTQCWGQTENVRYSISIRCSAPPVHLFCVCVSASLQNSN